MSHSIRTSHSVSLALAMAYAAVLGLALAPAGACAQTRVERRIDSTFAFGRNGWVDIQLSSGTIIVNGWTRPDARVMGRAERGYIEADLSGTRINISTRRERGDTRRSQRGDVEIEVSVPVGTRVMVSTASGDIRVRGTAAEVQATAASGNIEVVDAAERIAVETMSGDIRVDKARGRTIIGTTSGDMELADLVGPLEIRAVSSDINLRGVESADVRIGTTSGDISYEGTVDPKGTYDIKAHAGDITFALPSNAGATLSLQTYSGDIDSAFPMTLQPGMNLRQRNRRMEFDVGGGGARISIVTFSGDINIVRGFARTPREE